MGGVKRFYCHYCNSNFPYSREGRKKHNDGQNHKRNHQAHYQQFWTAKERYEQEMQKEKCRKFQSGQGCPYGDECRFSHASQYDLQQLQQQAASEEQLKEYGPLPSQLQRNDLLINSGMEDIISHVNDSRKQRLATLLNARQGQKSKPLIAVDEVPLVGLNSATKLRSNDSVVSVNLPASLQQFSVEDFLKQPSAQWGTLS